MVFGLERIVTTKRLLQSRSNIAGFWRRERDLNPRYLAVHTISNRAHSAALTSLRICKNLVQLRDVFALRLKKAVFAAGVLYACIFYPISAFFATFLRHNRTPPVC